MVGSCNCVDVSIIRITPIVPPSKSKTEVVIIVDSNKGLTCVFMFLIEKTVPVERMWVLYLALKGLLGNIKVLLIELCFFMLATNMEPPRISLSCSYIVSKA